jgi:tRNA (guanine-N7-)-methyltransferase
MRLRIKPWARNELHECSFYIKNPVDNLGKWHSVFKKQQELWLELGCGKGGFISQLASVNPDKNFMAIDIKDAVLGLAKRKIEEAYTLAGTPTENIFLMSHEIMIINRMLNENDLVHRIFINFCNPWSRFSHHRRRLTYPTQLKQYLQFLAPNGQIRFKTDDEPLFKDSVRYFEKSGFKIIYMTEDLHASGFSENVETEHERMYSSEGHKIKFLIAEKIQGES